MKIVIAPAAFQGSLSPLQASRAMELGVRSVLPQAETIMAPVADGGDGTMEAILYAQKSLAVLESHSSPSYSMKHPEFHNRRIRQEEGGCLWGETIPNYETRGVSCHAAMALL